MEISIDSPQASFDKHLQQDQNERILFSGKFGTGKSYFLKKYFEQRKDQYNLFWISPVDYVVGANQDIFEWIKIDIAKQLVLNYIEKEEQKKVPKRQVIALYVMNNIGKVFTDIAMFVAQPKVDKIFSPGFFDILEKHHRKAEQLGAAINEPGDDDKITKYVSAYTQLIGTIYEDNSITQLIRAAITTIAASAEKENILIIDDLDRLDPEHIFRILNILSAHNNHFESNKFGFNKVILVCDFENIKHIFKHKYGADCDFNGYIEKFYSYEPFHYNLKDAVAMYCNTQTIVNTLDEKKHFLLKFLLITFIENGLITTRQLNKIVNKQANHENYVYRYDFSKSVPKGINIENPFISKYEFEVDFTNYEFVKVAKILVEALGGVVNLLSAFKLFENPDKVRVPNHDVKALEEAIFDDVIILSNLKSQNSNNKPTCFYSTTIIDKNTYIYDYPIFQVMGIKLGISLIWDQDNPYTQGEYFKTNVRYSLLGKYRNQNRTSTAFDILKEVQNATEFLASQNIFSRPAH